MATDLQDDLYDTACAITTVRDELRSLAKSLTAEVVRLQASNSVPPAYLRAMPSLMAFRKACDEASSTLESVKQGSSWPKGA